MRSRSPDRPEAAQARRRAARRRHWRRVAAALIVLFAVFCAASARLFIWPAQGMPAHVNAIVVLGGTGNRVGKGLELARQGRADFLVISLGLPTANPPSACASRAQAFKVICFDPDPGTTQGEAEYVGRLAKQYHWGSVVLVTTPDQDTRARVRFGRCTPSQIYVVTTPLPASLWPYEIAYQWAALFKAVVLQRSC
jgi:uncharacterized SAM-binding protein YcdF (DUF218 family)